MTTYNIQLQYKQNDTTYAKLNPVTNSVQCIRDTNKVPIVGNNAQEVLQYTANLFFPPIGTQHNVIYTESNVVSFKVGHGDNDNSMCGVIVEKSPTEFKLLVVCRGSNRIVYGRADQNQILQNSTDIYVYGNKIITTSPNGNNTYINVIPVERTLIQEMMQGNSAVVLPIQNNFTQSVVNINPNFIKLGFGFNQIIMVGETNTSVRIFNVDEYSSFNFNNSVVNNKITGSTFAEQKCIKVGYLPYGSMYVIIDSHHIYFSAVSTFLNANTSWSTLTFTETIIDVDWNMNYLLVLTDQFIYVYGLELVRVYGVTGFSYRFTLPSDEEWKKIVVVGSYIIVISNSGNYYYNRIIPTEHKLYKNSSYDRILRDIMVYNNGNGEIEEISLDDGNNLIIQSSSTTSPMYYS